MTADDVVPGDVGPKVSFSIKTGSRADSGGKIKNLKRQKCSYDPYISTSPFN
jgi:hypothetical protein